MANTATSTQSTKAAPTTPRVARAPQRLRWHPARLLYVFVVTLVVGIIYSEVQAVLADPTAALDPAQLQNTFFWRLALGYPLYVAAACVLALGAAVLGWRVERRYAAVQAAAQREETVVAVLQRAQAGGQLSSAAVPHDLPPRAPGFVGRQREVAAVAAALGQGQAVALVGMGGLGKSSLAAEAVHTLSARADNAFPGGMTWARCDERSGLDGVIWIEDQLLSAWNAALPGEVTARAATPEEGLELREQALRRRLGAGVGGGQPQAKLVLLDNVEPGMPLGRLLDTLQPLGIAALVTTRVEPTTQHIRLFNLDVLDKDAAARLFAARYADRGGKWDAERDAPATAQIVDALGGLPLAIELAAARAARTRLPLATLAQELRAPDALARLNDPRDPSAGVSYSLRKTLLALSPSQRVRFAALGLPEGPDWPLPLVERMFAGVPQATEMVGVPPDLTLARADLEALAAYSLVSLSNSAAGAAPRVRLHPLVRELAREEWAQLDEDTRHAALAALLASVNARFIPSLSDKELLAVLVPDQELIEGTLRQAYVEQVALPLALAATTALSRYLVTFYHPDVWQELGNYQLQAARALGDRGAELAALDSLAKISETTAHGDDAVRYRQEALPIARELGEPARVVEYTAALGSSAAEAGRLDEARQRYDEAMSAARGMTENPLDGRMFNILGILAAKIGRLDEAALLLQRASRRASDTGDLEVGVLALYNLGDVYDMRGDFTEARRLFDQSLALRHEARAAVGQEQEDAEVEGPESVWDDRAGEIALKTGNFEAAVAHFRHALRTVEASHFDPSMIPHLHGNLAAAQGEAARQRGDTSGALRGYQEALNFYAQEGRHVYNHLSRDYVTFVKERITSLLAPG